MKALLRLAVLLAIVSCCASAAPAEVTEGQVFVIADWTLYIRTADDAPVAFNPWYTPGSLLPAPPSRTVLPALESGEMVRVTWTLDVRDGRRRIDRIEIISALTGATKGIVSTASTTQLIIRPKDEPGTVAMNPRSVKVGTRFVPDPVISPQIARLRPGTKVTVNWAWDNEGRKRITGVVVGW